MLTAFFFLCTMLFIYAFLLDAKITTRKRWGGPIRPGQTALDVVYGVSVTLIMSYAISSALISAYPFFATLPGIYLTVLFSFAISGAPMIWGEISRNKKGLR